MRTSRVFVVVAFAIALVASFACKRGAATPPEVTEGVTTCAACQRTIRDMSIASVALSKADGTVKAFDKTRCLHNTIPHDDQWHVWFRDFDGSGWIESSKAAFVLERSGPARTIVRIPAFAGEAKASAFVTGRSGRNEIVPNYDILRGVLTHQF